MMRLPDSDLWIGSARLLASIHERYHACQVRLIRQQLQIVEQANVILEAVRDAGGAGYFGQLLAALLFCFLDPPFHVAKGSQIIVHLTVISRTELLLKLLHAVGNRIENAPVLLET